MRMDRMARIRSGQTIVRMSITILTWTHHGWRIGKVSSMTTDLKEHHDTHGEAKEDLDGRVPLRQGSTEQELAAPRLLFASEELGPEEQRPDGADDAEEAERLPHGVAADCLEVPRRSGQRVEPAAQAQGLGKRESLRVYSGSARSSRTCQLAVGATPSAVLLARAARSVSPRNRNNLFHAPRCHS